MPQPGRTAHNNVLLAARITVDEVKTELAVALFRLERFSLGRAAELAGVPTGQFLNILAARKLGPHMDADEALKDAAMLAEMRRAS